MQQARYNNNMVIKFDEKNPPDLEVFKCPKLRCSSYFFSYEDLASHKALQHGDMPKFLLGQQDQTTYFNTDKIGKLQRYSLQSSIQKRKTMLEMFVHNREEKTTEPIYLGGISFKNLEKSEDEPQPRIARLFARIVAIFKS